ncbi:hypothetical protein [Avibacterium sp. 21-594]|uniref:hypothetical protein n=1 Tax=Avibacterium sp. 21-594 TaxID=2911535 RepID=UPI002246BDC8|nr:hypothetical protein [Avibacterium sp. 21-594]MCW9716676.1 hypothetical protein [Avibacterium sp. 21-594]
MIEFVTIILFIFILAGFVIGIPLAIIFSSIIVVKNSYDFATNTAEKINALCLPLTMATPFIYYNLINDSLWQAALSFLIIPTLIHIIWGDKEID